MPAPAVDLHNRALDQLFETDNYPFFHDAFMPPERRALEVGFPESALELRSGLSVLDLACGHGRHSNHLALRVEKVVGIDRNTAFLDLARVEAAEPGVTNVQYCVGDIRDITDERAFDRVMLVNTVFGLFSDGGGRSFAPRVVVCRPKENPRRLRDGG